MVFLFKLLSWSNASPIKSVLPQEVLSIGKSQLDKTSSDSVKVLPLNGILFRFAIFFFKIRVVCHFFKILITNVICVCFILAITDSNKLKDKQLFGFDESSLVKLKGYKIIPKDGDKSNIMKILFPRKHFVERLSSHVNKTEQTTDEQIISTIQNSDAKDLEKDFIQVDDILMVRDPMDINLEANNVLNEQDDDMTATETIDSIYMDTTEKPLKDMTLAERLKHAAKRRMIKKMTKLEMSLQRELFKREDVHSDKLKTIDESVDNVETTTKNVSEAVVEKQDEASGTGAPKISANEGEIISATLGKINGDSEAVTEDVKKPEDIQPTSETPQSTQSEGTF